MALIKLTTIKGNKGNIVHQKSRVKASEAKALIMNVNKWTDEEYRKNYFIIRNKLRAYEAFMNSQGIATKKQSVVELLYKEAKAKKHYGKDYEPSLTMQRIKGFTSISSGKKGQAAVKNQAYINKRLKIYEAQTKERFSSLIAKNAKAREIYNNIKNPIMRERALIDYANQLHYEIEASGKVSGNTDIPISTGEAIGSGQNIDFDYEAYKAYDEE